MTMINLKCLVIHRCYKDGEVRIVFCFSKVLYSHEMLNLIESLAVKPPTILSDHSQIICWIKRSPVSSQSKPHQHQTLFNLPKQYIWNNDSAQNFFDTLETDEFQSKLSLFEQTVFSLDSKDVELATEQFTNLLNEISLRSLKLSCGKNQPRNKLSKKWFDDDCKVLRRSLKVLSNMKQRSLQ